MGTIRPSKLLFWTGSSRKDFSAFPNEVRHSVGYALYQAQIGGKHPDAKALTRFGGGVLEVVTRHDGDTYRTVYTVKLDESVYVVHAFKKKSKSGIKTPQAEIELIRRRLKMAEEHHAQNQPTKGRNNGWGNH